MKLERIGNMPNKIKDIFSIDQFSWNGRLRFQDDEAYKSFIAALEIVESEGRAVPVEGVTSISMGIEKNGVIFPVETHDNISQFQVLPSIEIFEIPVPIVEGERKLKLKRYRINKGLVIESMDEAIVYLKIAFDDELSRHTLTYRVDFSKAETIAELLENFKITSAFMSMLYNDDIKEPYEEVTRINSMKQYFRQNIGFFERLERVQSLLNIKITPEQLEDMSENDQHEIDELYLALCAKKVFRVDSVTSNGEMLIDSIDKPELKIGAPIAAVFKGKIDFAFLNHKVELVTVNVLKNAVIKEIKKMDEGLKVLYDGTDSKPMYVLFTVFQKPEEADEEIRTISSRSEKYSEAKTRNEYIEELYNL